MIVKGLPTQTKTFGGKRYRLHGCTTNKKAADQEARYYRRKGYSVMTVVFDGQGALPKVKQYCAYFRWPEEKRPRSTRSWRIPR